MEIWQYWTEVGDYNVIAFLYLSQQASFDFFITFSLWFWWSWGLGFSFPSNLPASVIGQVYEVVRLCYSPFLDP